MSPITQDPLNSVAPLLAPHRTSLASERLQWSASSHRSEAAWTDQGNIRLPPRSLRCEGVGFMAIAALSGWTSEQKHVVVASFLGWTLDAFDFFLLVFVLKDIAAEFQTDISDVTLAI